MSGWVPGYPAAAETHGSVEEKIRFDGMHTGKVTLQCPWADRFTVAAAIMNSYYPNGALGAICSEVLIKPEAGRPTVDGDGKLVYETAVISVSYDVATASGLEKYPAGPHADELYTESLVPTVEHQTLDPSGFAWAGSTGTPLREGPVRQLYGLGIKRVLYNRPSIHADYFTLPGKTNAAPYTSVPLGKTFAAETLLFVPQEFTRTVTTLGSNGWTVPMLLKYKEDGWNKFWNKDKSGDNKWDTIYDRISASTYKNFPPADFSNLVY